jgi:hypothetical protein
VFVFALGSALFIATTFLVRELPEVHGTFSWANLRWLSRENPAFRHVFVASIFRGMSYNGLLPVTIQLFTFSALQRELPVAGLSGLGAILALFVGGAVSRALRAEGRERVSWISSMVLLALGGALALFPTGLLGSVYLVAAPLAVVALTAATSSVDNAIFGYGDCLVGECGVARELGLMIGRVTMALPLMIGAAGPQIVGAYLAFLSLMYPVQVLVLFRNYQQVPALEQAE